MILLALFGIIIAVVFGLNFYDDYHIEQIKKYYSQNQCKALSHYHGKYQAICGNYIIMYQNSFALDINNPTLSINLKQIDRMEDKIQAATASTNAKNNVLITVGKQEILFEFENIDSLKNFKGVMNK